MPVPLVESDWLAENLDRSDLRILDCSVVMLLDAEGRYRFEAGRAEWECGHIPGSVFADVIGELSDRDQALPLMMPPPDLFAARMSSYGVSDDSRVVLYDRGNHAWAARVWWMLRAVGLDAAVLNGGWVKWSREGRPTTTDTSSHASGSFSARFRPELVAGKPEVLGSMRAERVCLINALSPEEHRGVRSNFARAGRIPGSENVFCQSLIDPLTGGYLPIEQLRSRFATTQALTAEKVIVYCGAGIAASSDALALSLLGRENVAVYDGSLAEWTADPTLPMEIG
jgi:thiosulfate/3-mercaptopyruvate sulfurtransferase